MRRKTEQVVVGLGVVLIDEVHVVCADELDAVFLRQFDEYAIHPLLLRKSLAVGPKVGVGDLVAHQLEVVVVAEHALVPLN